MLAWQNQPGVWKSSCVLFCAVLSEAKMACCIFSKLNNNCNAPGRRCSGFDHSSVITICQIIFRHGLNKDMFRRCTVHLHCLHKKPWSCEGAHWMGTCQRCVLWHLKTTDSGCLVGWHSNEWGIDHSSYALFNTLLLKYLLLPLLNAGLELLVWFSMALVIFLSTWQLFSQNTW